MNKKNQPYTSQAALEPKNKKLFELKKKKEFYKVQETISDLSRRNLLKGAGASLAIAGLSSCAIIRKPEQKIYPYGQQPEDIIPGKPLYYASVLRAGDQVQGVLVENHQGRPTKIENNPGFHPLIKGTSAQVQASVLDLYEPDRLKKPQINHKEVDQTHLMDRLQTIKKAMQKNRGDGTAILLENNYSPSQNRLLKFIKSLYPKVHIAMMDEYSNNNQREVLDTLAGSSAAVQYRFDKADVILSLESDFLSLDAHPEFNAAAFAKRRTPENKKGMNRLYQVESTYTSTGSKADHRFKLSPTEVEDFACAVLVKISGLIPSSLTRLNNSFMRAIQPRAMAFLTANSLAAQAMDEVAKDLVNYQGRGIVLPANDSSELLHAISLAINEILGNVSRTVLLHRSEILGDSVAYRGQSFKQLLSKIENKAIKTLFLLGGNPVYSLQRQQRDTRALFESVEECIQLSSFKNDTSKVSEIIIPQSHSLETWGDMQTIDGYKGIVQPLIRPMYESMSVEDILLFIQGSPFKIKEFVRGTTRLSTQQFKKALHDGYTVQSQQSQYRVNLKAISAFTPVKPEKNNNYFLQVIPDSRIVYGQFERNTWLQELPDAMTKTTWENVLRVSAKAAKKIAGGNKKLVDGDVVKISDSQNSALSVELPVYVMMGQDDQTVTTSLGYGQGFTNINGHHNTGKSLFPFLKTGSNALEVLLEATGKNTPLATVQDHNLMEGRELHREGELEEYKEHPDFAAHRVHTPPYDSLWEEADYSEGYQWGMTIDLSKCSACNACTTACQAENNIPIVGKEEVLRGREMHWIRIDRYFKGDENTPEVVHQPVGCTHCENAPCESVCPVNATVHSQEGLNDMVYNRCVGTRFCGNNCPLKVRRFNFFDFHQKNPQSVKRNSTHIFDYQKDPPKSLRMQFNPDVTVRMRGVMEKCTYCVQRINHSKIEAKNENRTVRDGEIKSACQQACPSQAIVFGNINDKNSAVAKSKENKRNYELLGELNIKPRTTYLASILNPNPAIQKKMGNSEASHTH